MTDYQEVIIDVKNGEITTRPYTTEEIAAVELAKKEAKIKSEAYLRAATAKEAAESKLAALGLTADDLKALGLG